MAIKASSNFLALVLAAEILARRQTSWIPMLIMNSIAG
jgi:hypothetical protein